LQFNPSGAAKIVNVGEQGYFQGGRTILADKTVFPLATSLAYAGLPLYPMLIFRFIIC
jgi:hypothetical protein